MSSIILKNLYKEDKKIPMLIRNNVVLYKMVVKPIFVLSVDSINIMPEETASFTITANDKWTITAPEEVVLSSYSGYGNTTITLTGNSECEGLIAVTCDGVTKTISITVETKTDFSSIYLTFKITSAGNINVPTGTTYSINGGNWQNTGTTLTVNGGESIRFKGNNTTYQSNNFSGSTAGFKVEGNIMSLIYSDNFIGQTSFSGNNIYMFLFRNCTGLTSSENLILPATSLTQNCYQYMFSGCTSLVSSPALPATTLASNCYQNMFQGCRSLVSAPSILPATTLASNCYQNMFNGCTSLTTTPSLPATTLASNCYQNMFNGCRSLVSAPELPATTLVNYCYYYMFRNCTSLTTAPVLSATTLGVGSYMYMFNGCSSLNYIKCLATDISATNCTYNWVRGVGSTGTFVQKSGVSWSIGESGIPSGWTVQNV